MGERDISRRRLLVLGAATIVTVAGCGQKAVKPGSSASPAGSVRPSGPPIVYSTDLSHPHMDPDDHFDLAVAHGLGLDVRTVILDRNTSVGATPGFAPVAQLNALTGHAWPARDGLIAPLRTPRDQGAEGNDNEASAAVLDVLRSADRRVAVVSVGSCRDIAAAYNSDPELFHERIERLVVFAGEASMPGFVEHNVGLDPFAYVRLMGSGLPIRWVPCFDGGPWQAGVHSSFVQVPQADLLPPDLPTPLLRYFLYMVRRETSDAIDYLSQPLTVEDTALLGSGTRNLWVGPLVALGDGAGTLRFDGAIVGRFEPTMVRFNDAGALDPNGRVTARVDRLRVLDRTAWQRGMVAGVVGALRQIPLTTVYR